MFINDEEEEAHLIALHYHFPMKNNQMHYRDIQGKYDLTVKGRKNKNKRNHKKGK